jgi:hypothetical protein
VLQHRAGRPHPGARLIGRALAFAAVLSVAACQQAATQYDAAEDVRAFIVAVREGDRAAFERHIDRPILRAQLLEQVKAQAGPLGGVLGEGLVDQLLRPEGFRLALEQAGAPQRTPTAAEIATQLRVVENGRVCLPRSQDGPCAITFAQSGSGDAAVWRLVAIDPGDVQVGPR